MDTPEAAETKDREPRNDPEKSMWKVRDFSLIPTKFHRDLDSFKLLSLAMLRQIFVSLAFGWTDVLATAWTKTLPSTNGPRPTR